MDVLLLMAASENDMPKIEELLKAGADVTVKVGKSCNWVLSTRSRCCSRMQ